MLDSTSGLSALAKQAVQTEQTSAAQKAATRQAADKKRAEKEAAFLAKADKDVFKQTCLLRLKDFGGDETVAQVFKAVGGPETKLRSIQRLYDWKGQAKAWEAIQKGKKRAVAKGELRPQGRMSCLVPEEVVEIKNLLVAQADKQEAVRSKRKKKKLGSAASFNQAAAKTLRDLVAEKMPGKSSQRTVGRYVDGEKESGWISEAGG